MGTTGCHRNANAGVPHLSSTAATLKFKEIDGGQQKWWNMWFNPIQRVTPYHGSISPWTPPVWTVPPGEPELHGCRQFVP